MFPVEMEVNATSPASYPEFHVANQLWKYCSPVMLALGTIGNIFCIVTLLRKNLRRQTTVIYLVTLSVNDLVVLYSGLLRQWMIKAFDIDIRSLSEFTCKLHLWIVYVSLDISAWILVIVTLERVTLVWFPLASKSKYRKKIAAVILSSLIGTMMSINSHLLYGIGNVTKMEDNSTVLKVCFYKNIEYQNFFVDIWPWIDLAKFNAVPFVIILIGNICIIANVIKNHKKVHRTVVPQGTQLRAKKLNSMTATLIVLNTAFLISTTPISIYLAFYEKWTKNASYHDKARLKLLWAVVNLLMYSNNTLNFLLYCVSGGNFRKEIRHLCLGATQSIETTRATTLKRKSVATNRLPTVG